MNKRTLGLVAAAMLGGLSLGAGTSSAAPLAVPGIQTDHALATPVQMTRSERMMMRDRMMKRRMMERRMMERRMMRRKMMQRRMMNRM
ncbi:MULTISPECIES: hypothetical protein [Methylorubrum]|uniref:Pentapeptide MXKDX repeat protein n=1 Tax=Methylorubrum salsuginis TaxID=414703 RepID=A0A1I4MS94_9HYPH|nr:hypothetical protein [Methylorubrum salsuginis]OAH21881.1 hypothetical protein AX289_25490 [Methylorubrum populi]SFM06098.1 hypothetical protein SAMN04488125_14318 [Methylorubrum salsuginis]